MEASKSHTFSISNVLVYAWKNVRLNFKFLFISVVIYAVISTGFSLLRSMVVGDSPNPSSFQVFLDIVLTSVEVTISLIFAIGFVRIALSFLDGKKPQYVDLWDNWGRKVWHLFLSLLIYLVMVFVGLVVLIVPGIYLALKFHYFPYFIVDKNMGPIEALKASGKLTRGNMWKLFALGLVFVGISILLLVIFLPLLYASVEFGPIIISLIGFTFVVIGNFLSSAVVLLVQGTVYRKLSGGHISEPKDLTSDVPFVTKVS